MPLKNNALWKRAFHRTFTKESIQKARARQDPDLLEEKEVKLSTCDSCEPFLALERADRIDAYLTMTKEMTGASSGTLRKLKRRLNIE